MAPDRTGCLSSAHCSWTGPSTLSRICAIPALQLSPVQCQHRRNGILTIFPTDTCHIRPPSSFTHTPPRFSAHAGEECWRAYVRL